MHATGTVNPSGAAALVPVPAPATSFATPQTGGDGYAPILYGPNVYNVFHHFNGGSLTIPKYLNCFSKTTGAAARVFPRTCRLTAAAEVGSGLGLTISPPPARTRAT